MIRAATRFLAAFGLTLAAALQAVGQETAALPPAAEPAIPAPAVGAFAPAAARPAPLRLLGVDLLQEGAPVAPDVLLGGRPLVMRFHWIPSRRAAAAVPFEVTFVSAGSRISRRYELAAAPEPGAAPWEGGCVYLQPQAIDLPSVATAMSGDVSIIVQLIEQEMGAIVRRPLQQIRARVSPAVVPGQVSRRAVAAFFGETARPLNVSFRLGSGAAAEVPLPAGVSGAAAETIGLVSAFSYGDIPQGGPVCMVEVLAGDEVVRQVELRSGEHSARADYDYRPEEQKHDKTSVVESWLAEYGDAEGAPFNKHKYGVRIPIGADAAARATALRFRAAADVVFDVYEVVLAPEPAGGA